MLLGYCLVRKECSKGTGISVARTSYYVVVVVVRTLLLTVHPYDPRYCAETALSRRKETRHSPRERLILPPHPSMFMPPPQG